MTSLNKSIEMFSFSFSPRGRDKETFELAVLAKERWYERISRDGVPSCAQDFREFNIVLGASVDSPEGCNGVLNLRGSQPRISSPFRANRFRPFPSLLKIRERRISTAAG